MSHYRVEIERLDAVALINLRCEEVVATAIGDTIGLVFPFTLFQSMEMNDARVVRLAPDQWWIRTTLVEEAALYDRLKAASHGRFAALTIISDHFQGFRISGPDLNAILGQAVSVDLANLQTGSVIRSRFARTGATLFTLEPGAAAEVFVESSYADYVEQWLAVATGLTSAAPAAALE